MKRCERRWSKQSVDVARRCWRRLRDLCEHLIVRFGRPAPNDHVTLLIASTPTSYQPASSTVNNLHGTPSGPLPHSPSTPSTSLVCFLYSRQCLVARRRPGRLCVRLGPRHAPSRGLLEGARGRRPKRRRAGWANLIVSCLSSLLTSDKDEITSCTCMSGCTWSDSMVRRQPPPDHRYRRQWIPTR